MLEELKDNSLVRGGVVIVVLVIISAGVYFKFYRPLINEFFDIQAKMQSLGEENPQAQAGYQGYQPVTEEERKTWQLVVEKMYKKFPPPEDLPKQITFNESLDRFYGQGLSMQNPPPKLMQEIVRTAYQSNISKINLVMVNSGQASETFSSAEANIQPIKIESSQIQLIFTSRYQQLAEFLERLSQLPQLVKATKILLQPSGDEFRVKVTLVTYHFQKGA